jgi:hypothetical protein
VRAAAHANEFSRGRARRAVVHQVLQPVLHEEDTRAVFATIAGVISAQLPRALERVAVGALNDIGRERWGAAARAGACVCPRCCCLCVFVVRVCAFMRLCADARRCVCMSAGCVCVPHSLHPSPHRITGDIKHLLLALRWRIVPVVVPDAGAPGDAAGGGIGGATGDVDGAGSAGVAALRVIEQWALAHFNIVVGVPAAAAAVAAVASVAAAAPSAGAAPGVGTSGAPPGEDAPALADAGTV